jgi:hypothetical protein
MRSVSPSRLPDPCGAAFEFRHLLRAGRGAARCGWIIRALTRVLIDYALVGCPRRLDIDGMSDWISAAIRLPCRKAP